MTTLRLTAASVDNDPVLVNWDNATFAQEFSEEPSRSTHICFNDGTREIAVVETVDQIQDKIAAAEKG